MIDDDDDDHHHMTTGARHNIATTNMMRTPTAEDASPSTGERGKRGFSASCLMYLAISRLEDLFDLQDAGDCQWETCHE